MKGPLTTTTVQEESWKTGIQKETIPEERICRERPDSLVIKMSTQTKFGVFVIVEFKQMSDVTDQDVIRTKRVTGDQYSSIESVRTLDKTLDPQG